MINTHTHTLLQQWLLLSIMENIPFHPVPLSRNYHERGRKEVLLSSKQIRWLMWGDNICTFVWLDTKYTSDITLFSTSPEIQPLQNTVFSPLSLFFSSLQKRVAEGEEIGGWDGRVRRCEHARLNLSVQDLCWQSEICNCKHNCN